MCLCAKCVVWSGGSGGPARGSDTDSTQDTRRHCQPLLHWTLLSYLLPLFCIHLPHQLLLYVINVNENSFLSLHFSSHDTIITQNNLYLILILYGKNKSLQNYKPWYIINSFYKTFQIFLSHFVKCILIKIVVLYKLLYFNVFLLFLIYLLRLF